MEMIFLNLFITASFWDDLVIQFILRVHFGYYSVEFFVQILLISFILKSHFKYFSEIFAKMTFFK